MQASLIPANSSPLSIRVKSWSLCRVSGHPVLPVTVPSFYLLSLCLCLLINTLFHSQGYSGLDTYCVITQTLRPHAAGPLPASPAHLPHLLCSLGASHSALLFLLWRHQACYCLKTFVLHGWLSPQIFAWFSTSCHSGLRCHLLKDTYTDHPI